MNQHLEPFWGAIPPATQRIIRSTLAGAGIGALTGGSVAAFKEMAHPGVQQAPGTNTGQWQQRQAYRSHHRHHGGYARA